MLKVTKIHENQNVSFILDDCKEQTLERMHFIDYINEQLNINSYFLVSSDLSGCVFINEVFERINFDGANLTNCDLRGAKFISCLLSKAKIIGCFCNRTHFYNCNLSKSNLFGSYFENASLSRSFLRDANISNVTFINTDLFNADFGGCVIDSN